MNFDIKYATYLQIFNFTKIKQNLGVFLGTHSHGSKTKGPEPTWVQIGDG